MPVLEPPVLQAIEPVTTGQFTSLSPLDLEDRRDQKRRLEKQYSLEYKEYQAKDLALRTIRTTIKSSIHASLEHFTQNCSTARDMIIKLQQRVAPTTLGY